jgi:hypothetical protein
MAVEVVEVVVHIATVLLRVKPAVLVVRVVVE